MGLTTSHVPVTVDLVLLGGGHSHAIVLRQWGMKPVPGVRLTLITDTTHTPYSGMLPGYIAGFYDFDACHIDLRRLAQFAGAQFVLDRAIGLDLSHQRVLCAHHPAIAFDYLSIAIGSTPAQSGIPGVAAYGTPVKPVPPFLNQWSQLVATLEQDPRREPIRLGIVGGGTGGVELALTTRARLARVAQQTGSPLPVIHLFHRGMEPMTGHPQGVRRRFRRLLTHYGVALHLGETVCSLKPLDQGLPDPVTLLPRAVQVVCQSGLTVTCDRVLWVTQASAPTWLRAAGLATDDRGFMAVNSGLQSISHPHVFGAGDVATLVHAPRPKAGVFAVRQGRFLMANLCRIITGQPLVSFRPQARYLALVGNGHGGAIAVWGGGWMGPFPWLWHWKDRIDRRFMAQFEQLPVGMVGREGRGEIPSQTSRGLDLGPRMRCAGCGSKVGQAILARVLGRLGQEGLGWDREDVLVGLGNPDDGAVIQVPGGQVLVQSLDFLPSLVSDPFVFGQIVANHCLSDLYAMGATPQSALALATIPFAGEAQVAETLYQLLAGALKVLTPAQVALVGGHTAEGAELAFGLACNGLGAADRLLRKGGMEPGQVLILTKALGTGTLFAAAMQFQAKGRWLDGAIATMVQANQGASTCFLAHGATACTDITGFGLLGHLGEMVGASQVGVALYLDSIPCLTGAQTTAQQGFLSSLQPQNLQAERFLVSEQDWSYHPTYPLLFDPQTSGGLLASVPPQEAKACLAQLRSLGYVDSQIIGRVRARGEEPARIHLAPHGLYQQQGDS